ncbi:uncharacterized protein IL334_004297 [Kwoniella shivajii]|uniref:Galactokinase n=1 Tax=Kwoniella shivajii TaxID=564305 RepID=A0ABZ1CZX8_9TREE|nr:hypothetical protein IL334_004297 [Kwoniella shivajii]
MAAKASIPIWNDLNQIYPSSSSVKRERLRWSKLINKFELTYGSKPKYIIRAPGRVNILGEHIDYSLFPVLPAAIEQDILVALRPTSPIKSSSFSASSSSASSSSSSSSSVNPVIHLSNVSDKYHSSTFTLTHDPSKGCDRGWNVDLDSAKGWDKYVRFAILESLAELYPNGWAKGNGKGIGPNSMDIMIDGNVPPGSGLSSSAAMVVASVLTFIISNNLEKGKTKEDVINLSIASEHRMGLRTGGMDQSASVLSIPHSLLHLEFHPRLLPTPLPLPPSLAVVITNSLAPHSLTDSAPEHYNLRVVEVLCATRILLHRWGLSGKAGKKRIWLREALDLWSGGKQGRNLNSQLDYRKLLVDTLDEIKFLRRENGWTEGEMIQSSGLSKQDFDDVYLHYLKIRTDRFHLYERLYHTLTESIRVYDFAQTCRNIASSSSGSSSFSSTPTCTKSLLYENGMRNHVNGSCHDHNETNKHTNGSTKMNGCSSPFTTYVNGSPAKINADSYDPQFTRLGELLNQSHDCMRDIYKCTHPFVDELQSNSLRKGALGSRMTGGGWGGSVISLIPIQQVDTFLQEIRNSYQPYKDISDDEFAKAAFATLPGQGAGVYVIDEYQNEFTERMSQC